MAIVVPSRIMAGYLIVGLVVLEWFSTSNCHSQDARPDSNAGNEEYVRAAIDSSYPNWESLLHNAGNIELSISNWGEIGTAYFDRDGGITKHCIFPKGSWLEHLISIELWIGAMIGRDTLVSTGLYGNDPSHLYQFHPDRGVDGEIMVRSILNSSPYRSLGAHSEQDYLCAYTDTVTDPELVGSEEEDGRPHKPLFVKVRQNSYAWSIEYTEDFVLFDFLVTNIGASPIRKMFIGFDVYGGLYHKSEYEYFLQGNTIVGYRELVDSSRNECRKPESMLVAWHADKDGHPTQYREWDYRSLRSVIGFYLLRPSGVDTTINFNWWAGSTVDPAYNWGPRLAPTDDDPWREIGWGLGHPVGDINRYYLLSHPEVDYDQLFTAIDHTQEGFMPPPPPRVAADLADGWANEYLLSFGPFDLAPGDSVPFSFALVAGENFHVRPTDFENYFNPYRPEDYYKKLDFSDLAENMRWARMVYDNPGVDTDGDGYRGEYCWTYIWRDTTADIPGDSFAVDSFRSFYTGDGVPDFKAMTPPQPPIVRTLPEYGRITLRWNGRESENTPDAFSGEADFEGYRVYMARDDRLTDFVLLASYDIDNYLVYEFNEILHLWKKISNSAGHDSLKTLYGPNFDANDYYDEYHYFVEPDTRHVIFFKPQDWNRSDLSSPLGIHKIYPDASQFDSTDNTEESWRRYYEYEYTIDNLEPSVPYYFAVTAFDHGAVKYNIDQLETSPTTNAVKEFALPSSATVEDKGLHVIVYPNPYRIDDGYARVGYENRDRTKSVERARRIHFGNLPPVCTIRIYTVDGDLVREIKHYYPEGGPSSQHEEWNVISRNTQAITTGIYIWSVRSQMGEQLGKLVIIK